MAELVGLFGTMLLEPWHPGKGAKPGPIIQFNCGEVHTHGSYKKKQNLRELNKNDPPFRQTIIDS